MLQLKNHSPFSPAITIFANEDGVDTLYLVVKATFLFDGQLSLAGEQIPPRHADEYWGDPVNSSLRYMSEMHLCKPATDIIVNGHACAPDGQSVTRLDCGIKVGEFSKRVSVFGNRYWQGNKITGPEPFTELPLIYENAYGGSYVEVSKDGNGGIRETAVLNPANPVGCGYRQAGGKAKDGERLPNIENPKDLIQSPGDQPEPVGLGFISAAWKPRVEYAGTYDEAWQKKRAPYLPEDFDSRFFNAAPTALQVPGYLQGGEPVVMVHLSRQKHTKFSLPICDLHAEIKIAGSTEAPDLNLETVLFEPDDRRICMTWRARLLCDKKALKISEVHLHGGWSSDTENIVQ